jgi:hypothetical protein
MESYVGLDLHSKNIYIAILENHTFLKELFIEIQGTYIKE